MNYFGKIISNISQVYSQINPATLTGAIDVIIVEQEDGTYICSPFHVRFGKMGVLRSREKIVEIEINGASVDIHMKLGDSGEAYFLEECHDDSDNIEHCANQILSSTDSVKQDTSTATSDDENPIKQTETLIVNNIDNNDDNSQNCDKENVKPDDNSTKILTQSDTVTPRSSATSQNSQKRVRRKKKSSKINSRLPISTCLNDPQLTENGRSDVLIDSNQDSDHEVYLNNNSNTKHDSESLSHHYSDAEIHPFSDSEISQSKYKRSDSIKNAFDCKSDSEYEIFKSNENQHQDQDNICWDWGELPNVQKDTNILHVAKKESNSANDEAKAAASSMLGGVLNFITKDTKDETDKGIYLDDLDPNDMNPEVAAKYFPKFRSSFSSSNRRNNTSDDDIESGNGASLSNSPNSIDLNYCTIPQSSDFNNQYDEDSLSTFDLVTINKVYHDLSMSLCGGIENLFSNPNDSERFLQSIISFDDFSENPLQMIENPNLVIRMGGKYYTWKMASSIILSYLMFQRPLPRKTFEMLKDHCIPKKKNDAQNAKSSWRSWFRSNQTEADQHNPNSNYRAQFGMPDSVNIDTLESSHTFNSSHEASSHSPNSIHEYISDDETINILLPSNSNRNSDSKPPNTPGFNKKNKYKKVLRLQSDVIKSLNLKPNSNDVEFSVTTAYQGTTICKSKIFLWRYDDQIVISDIDGTITKSDVLGHILPYIGQDWAQLGVTNLFSKIDNNGYKFLYLSARAIGQARGTRDYLRALRQDEVGLPDGPVLLSPTSLFSALHREVIDKKPEEFKIACLKDIQSLFPKNPFFAGFGNKINDTWAYTAVGIDMSRIFTINHKGELKLEKLLSFKSSYTDLSLFVDQMFAPLNQTAYNDEFSSFKYWRSEIPELPEQDTLVP